MLRIFTHTFILSSALLLSFNAVAADSKDAQELALVKSALQPDDGDSTTKKPLELLTKLSKSKELPVSYEATALLSECYRNANDLKSAERVLEKFDSFTGFEKLPTTVALPYFQCLLESAYVKALKGDVPGSLAILNWANARESNYEKALACLKYAEILLDLSEPERAKEYLKSFKAIAAKHLSQTDTGASIGQGGDASPKDVSTWKVLADKSFKLELEIEGCEIGKKFGDTYASYVKLRRIQAALKKSSKPRFYNEAMKLADEIISTDPASQFAAAAAYLKGDLMASTLTDKSSPKDIKAAKEVLEKLAKQKPDALYKGDALMLLGKISLEIEWDSKNAWDWYSAAYDHFKKTREIRDTLSMYAPMNDELKKQIAPTKKPTTLDQWNRIVYNAEDPLKLYNTASSSAWYVNDKEKNALFMLGFMRYLFGDYDGANAAWTQAGQLDEDLVKLQAQKIPNVIKRLQSACKLKQMAFGKEVYDLVKNKKLEIKLRFAEMCYMLEAFKEMNALYSQILESGELTPLERALTLIGLANSETMLAPSSLKNDREKIGARYELAMQIGDKTPIAEEALMRLACFYDQGSTTKEKGQALLGKYLDEYPKGKHIAKVKFCLGINAMAQGKFERAQHLLAELKIACPDSTYTASLADVVNDAEQRKIIQDK